MTELAEVRNVLQMIKQDAIDDAKSMDGKPFTGATVAPMLGQHLAMISALASALETTIAHLEAIKAGD